VRHPGVEPDPKWRRLEEGELPEGVKDGVVDRIDRRPCVVCFGVVSGGSTPFWEWLAGRGLGHAWTVDGLNTIGQKLLHDPVDVLLFDSTFGRGDDSKVWEAPHLRALVWHKSWRKGCTHPLQDGESKC
jgi:hypothetical protein